MRKDQPPKLSEQDCIQSLSIPLPASVSRLIQAGHLKEAEARIRFLLSGSDGAKDPFQKARLELELARLSQLPGEYPYSFCEALSLIHRQIPDFTEEEFAALEQEDRIDFIFLEGQKRYFRRFWETLTATDSALAKRADPQLVKETSSRNLFRNKTIQLLKEEGSLKYRIHLKAGLRIRDEFFEPGKEVLVHLPVPKESAPTCNIRILNTGHRPAFLSPADAPARTIAFQETPAENDTFWVEYEYDSIVNYVEPNPDLVSDSLPDFDTGQQLPHIRFTPCLRVLTSQVVGRESNPLIRAGKIYELIALFLNLKKLRLLGIILDGIDHINIPFRCRLIILLDQRVDFRVGIFFQGDIRRFRLRSLRLSFRRQGFRRSDLVRRISSSDHGAQKNTGPQKHHSCENHNHKTFRIFPHNLGDFLPPGKIMPLRVFPHVEILHVLFLHVRLSFFGLFPFFTQL